MDENLYIISGIAENVIYKNPQNGYIVLEIACGNELISVVGNLGDIVSGEKVRLTGSYTESAKYGRQFKAETCERMPPETAEEIRRYLASGIIKGLGPALAKKLTEKFHDETLFIIETEYERLTEIKGISMDRALYISTEYRRICSVKHVIEFLSNYRITPQVAISVWQQYESESVEQIKKNPYLLCQPGIDIDFTLADGIAREYDIDSYDHNRVEAAISYILRENASNGHTCLPLEVLQNVVCKQFDISNDCFEIVLENGTSSGTFAQLSFGQKTRVFLSQYYEAERYIADKLSLMLELNFSAQKDFSEEIASIEWTEGIKYEVLQKAAINGSLGNSVFILTGGPGTGKTTTLNALIQLCKQKRKSLALAAPTGRAAKRMSDLTGENAKTIHRMLEVDVSKDNLLTFKKNEMNPIKADIIIIDEMSMVDVLLFEATLRAIKPDSKLILVGDANQLPSVGAGNVLRDLIATRLIPSVELKEIFRQAAESLIVTNAHKIVNGETPDLDVRNKDFFFMNAPTDFEISRLVIELTKTRLPKTYGFSAFDDIQILTPTKMGEAGTKGLNSALQLALNPPSRERKEIRFFDVVFREGDKVMQTRNDYDISWKKDGLEGKGIFNGDIGIITQIDGFSGNMYINFEGRVACYSSEMLNKIEHAFAITIHKSQGSEYDAVIIPLTDISEQLLYRNLLYTAVTRAKKILILVGRKEVVKKMIDTVKKTTRYSCIQGLMKAYQLKREQKNEH